MRIALSGFIVHGYLYGPILSYKMRTPISIRSGINWLIISQIKRDPLPFPLVLTICSNEKEFELMLGHAKKDEFFRC